MSEADLIQEEASDPRHSGFLFNVNLIFLSSFLVNVLSFVIVVVIARLLGPGGRGVTSLYQTGINGTYAFISFGVAIGALYFVSRREVSNREAMESGLAATLAAAIISAAGVLVLYFTVGDQLRDADVPYWMAILAIPLVVQFRLTEVLLRSDGRFLAVSVMEALVPACALAGFLAVALFDHLTVGRSIIIWSLSPAAPLLLAYWCLGVEAVPRRVRLDDTTRRLVKFGLQGQAGNILQLFNYRLDSYLVLLFVNSVGVGLYSVGVSLSEGLLLVANAISVVLIPKLASSDREYASRTAALICRNTLLVTGLGAIALAVASPVLVPLLFGNRFHGAIEPLLFLLPGSVTLSGAKVLSAYVFSQGRPLINTWIAVVALAVTIGGDLALIPLIGVSGAAIASTLAYAASFVLTLMAFSRISGHSAGSAIVPRTADIGVGMEALRSLLARVRRMRASGASPALGS